MLMLTRMCGQVGWLFYVFKTAVILAKLAYVICGRTLVCYPIDLLEIYDYLSGFLIWLAALFNTLYALSYYFAHYVMPVPNILILINANISTNIILAALCYLSTLS